jgi:hypothetical protein
MSTMARHQYDDVPQDLVPIENRHVRRFIINGEWVYAVDDILGYFKEDAPFYKAWVQAFLQKRDEKHFQGMIREIEVDGTTVRVTNAVGIFRLVQGIRGRRADRLKTWLAQIAVERATEEVNPSLAVERAVQTWYRRGHSDAWIDERLRNIRVRKSFTDELQAHGVRDKQYAILTNIVHTGTFGIGVKDHYELKGLAQSRAQLREEMTTTELILSSLGEHTSTMLAKAQPVKGYRAAEDACKRGGEIAGKTRQEIEKALGQSVVTALRASDLSQESLPGAD